MSLTTNQIIASAQAMVQIANSMKALYVRAKEYSDYNGVTDPGWSALVSSMNPAVNQSTGLLVGTEIAPGDVSNAISSLNQFINYWTGQAVSTSAWGQNIQKLSTPIV